MNFFKRLFTRKKKEEAADFPPRKYPAHVITRVLLMPKKKTMTTQKKEKGRVAVVMTS